MMEQEGLVNGKRNTGHAEAEKRGKVLGPVAVS